MGISKTALAGVQKLYGKESVMKLSDAGSGVEFNSTGSLWLDYILGGGFPKGRVIELFGPESSGKTTVAIHAIAEVQKAGGNAFFCDAEHAFDPTYAEALGVNVDELAINQPDHGEQALNVTIAMIETGEVQLAIVDSTSALTPKSELEGEMEDAAIGVAARMLSKGLRKLSAAAKKHDCAVVFISQLRENIGPYGGRKIGVGNAMKFYASIRLNIRRSQPIMVEGKAVGHTMMFKSEKNKVFPPFKECEVVLKYGQGYDTNGEVLTMAAEMGIVEKKGSWFAYKGENLAQGLEKTTAILEDNPELFEELKKQVEEGLKQQ